MKYLIVVLLLVSFASASCIDLNSATIDKLDEIVWIGPATAEKIIDSRPFDSIEDLDSVSGIGEKKLQDIIDEGLACVESEEEIDVKIVEEKVEIIQEIVPVLLEESESVVLGDVDSDVIVYESKSSVVVDYLPCAFCVFLILIIGILIWQRF